LTKKSVIFQSDSQLQNTGKYPKIPINIMKYWKILIRKNTGKYPKIAAQVLEKTQKY